jgi:hypothetical protein
MMPEETAQRGLASLPPVTGFTRRGQAECFIYVEGPSRQLPNQEMSWQNRG